MMKQGREIKKEIDGILRKWAKPRERGYGTGYDPDQKLLVIDSCPSRHFPEGLSAYYGEIEKLIISRTRLTEKSTQMIGEIKALKSLHLNGVDFEGKGLELWDRLVDLTDLRINNVAIKELPNWVSSLKSLDTLDISSTRIQNIPERLIRNLKVLVVAQTPVRELPNLKDVSQLERLDIGSTQIQKIPSYYMNPALKIFNAEQSALSELPEALSELPDLEYLNVRSTEVSVLPASMNSVRKIKVLDIGHSKISTLPEWIGFATALRILGLNGCRLITIDIGWLGFKGRYSLQFKDEALEAHYDILDRIPTHLRGIYVKELTILDFDVRILKNDEQKLLQNLADESDLTTSHEMKIYVAGDSGVGKTTVINHILNEKEHVPIEDALEGLRVVAERAQLFEALATSEAPTGIHHKEENPFYSNTHLEVWELSGDPDLQLIHPMLLTDEGAYIIVLDARDTTVLHQRALYWIRFIEKSVISASVLFVMTHSDLKQRDVFDIQYIKKHTRLRVEETVCRFRTEVDIGKAFDGWSQDEFEDTAASELRWELRKIIASHPTYGIRIPSAWKRIKRHTEDLLETRNLISFARFEEICRYYGVIQDSADTVEIEKSILRWICDTGIAFTPKLENTKDTPNYIYHVSWFSRVLYSFIAHCKKNPQPFFDVKEWMQAYEDNRLKDDYYYTMDNADSILQIAAYVGVCFKTEGKYAFPSTMGILNLYGDAKEIDDRIINKDKLLHYVIKCGIVTADLIASLINATCKLLEDVLTKNETEYELKEPIRVGRNGLLALLTHKNTDQTSWVLLEGNIGCPAEIHIYGPRAESGSRHGFSSQVAKKIIQEFNALLSRYHGGESFENEVFIELYQGGDTALISLDDINENFKAGWAEYYSYKLKRTFDIVELMGYNFPQ